MLLDNGVMKVFCKQLVPFLLLCSERGRSSDWASCDIVLASAGSRGTGLPGTQELARINEDAKVTPWLLALMARHTTQLQSTQYAIWRHCHGNFWVETLAQTRGETHTAHLLAHTFVHKRAGLLKSHLSASLANLDWPFSREFSGAQAWVMYRSTHKGPGSIYLPCHWHSKSLSHACIHNGPITADGDLTPYLTITSVRVWER